MIESQCAQALKTEKIGHIGDATIAKTTVSLLVFASAVVLSSATEDTRGCCRADQATPRNKAPTSGWKTSEDMTSQVARALM